MTTNTQLQALQTATIVGIPPVYFQEPYQSPIKDWLLEWGVGFPWEPSKHKAALCEALVDPACESIRTRFISRWGVDPFEGVQEFLKTHN